MLAVIQSLNSIASEKKRITLEDLQLALSEQLNLKSCDKAFRHALYKSGEHICLTAYPDCCRNTAIRFRDYQRNLTLSDKNRIPEIDDTIDDRIQKKVTNYFLPRP